MAPSGLASQEHILLKQLDDLVLDVELGHLDGGLPVQILECAVTIQKVLNQGIRNLTNFRENMGINLHCSTVLQEKIHAFLPTVPSGIMQWGVLVLIQCIHCSTCLQKDLCTLELKNIKFIQLIADNQLIFLDQAGLPRRYLTDTNNQLHSSPLNSELGLVYTVCNSTAMQQLTTSDC